MLEFNTIDDKIRYYECMLEKARIERVFYLLEAGEVYMEEEAIDKMNKAYKNCVEEAETCLYKENNEDNYANKYVNKLRYLYEGDYYAVNGKEFIMILFYATDWVEKGLDYYFTKENISWIKNIVASRTTGA
jgi:hypothetical protein